MNHATPNRLIHAKSPYLIQHAYNPVDWYEWGEEALAKARSQNRPILLSIGYSACHWCHVMEHESFSDERVATLMNASFVCIKVDREERPDIDAVYMTAVQRMTGQGGWPMTMFLTPEGDPFYGGTYFPPEDRGRMPGFSRVLQSVHTAWHDREQQLREAGQDLRAEISSMLGLPEAQQAITAATIDAAIMQLTNEFDATYGGFGGAPKFPPAMSISHLFRAYQRTKQPTTLHMATHTLDMMVSGGMYDQIGGGFHRYSVDALWQIPHFEKMLYDNGLLLKAYAEGFHLTRNQEYARICSEIITWATTELRHPDGAFYAALDADTDGEEGKYYAWSSQELNALLGNDASLVQSFFKVDTTPNFEHHYVLQRRVDIAAFATQVGMQTADVRRIIDDASQILLNARAQRTKPHCDTKIIASWNGLMITGLATAGRLLGQPGWVDLAQKALDFIQHAMIDNHLLYRIWKDGERGATIGFLDDYANVAEAALAVYQANGDPRNLTLAAHLVHQILQRFYDTTGERMYDTSDLHEALIVRPAERTDNATPSGTATAIDLLFKMSVIADEPYYGMIAERLITAYTPLIERWPHGFGQLLQAAERAIAPSTEIVIAGRGALTTLTHAYAPLLALICYSDDDSTFSLCQNKHLLNDQQTVYVCRNATCDLPITNESALRHKFATLLE